jgi:tRNA pseudouridine32 synthase/23S rRNA pseudouridine746 synthase
VTVTPEEITARLLYRDGLMLVIDKPAGFAVHKGPKGGESLEDHFGALRFGLPRAPALAHRLDRDTSGCLVLGRHRKALAELGRLFKSGRIAKTYWAVVEGGPVEDEGRIDLPLGRKDATRGWWMKHDPQGQPAVTTWKVLGRAQSLATRGELAFAAEFPAGSSPPPCGEGLGVGVAVGGPSSHNNNDPPPQPSPNASRACPTCAR